MDSAAINPIGLAFTLAMGLLCVVLPRRYACVPIILLCCFMTMGQAIVVGSWHFTMIRVAMLFGWMRVLVRREWRRLAWNQVDSMIVLWSITNFVAYIALWQSMDAV